MRFSGKVALVTGAGRGIGRGIAERLASEGASVVVSDVDAGLAARTAAEIGNLAVGIRLDVTDRESVARAVEQIVASHKRIDFLVNNAGITIVGPVLDFKEHDWDRMIEINLKGVMRCSQLVGAQMVKQGAGKIVNISSQSGKTGRPLFTVYAATKFAVVGFTQGFAQELAPHRINVNAVCPGVVDTQMWKEIDGDLARLQGLRPGEALERRKNTIPLGRLERPDDVAGVVAFLLSADADYMSGQSINVTGGVEYH